MKTVTTWQGFTGTTGVIADAPCKTVISDGSGNRYAETDYYYDGGATLCGTLSTVQPVQGNAVTVVAGTHDDTNFGQSSTIPRGNLTQKLRWASTGTSPTTTHAYDATGQVAWIIDPCGNSTCTDVSGSNHKTTFSYADAYTVLSGGQNVSYTPTGQTNAYLTQITDALGHIANFTYDFYSGELTESTDPNSRSTTYLYNDPFARPTQVNFPDGGQKTIAYNDSPYNPSTPSPSVTATTLITSGTNIVNTVALDGMGHTVETILASDPSGADYVNTSYYGIGKPYQVTNPHRTTASPTDGTTTYTYDGLGRTTAVNQPDTSIVTTTYDQTSANANAICTTATDETGKSRQSCSDGLGRLIEVDEPGPGATASSPGTGSVTIGGSEQMIPGVSGSASLSVSGGGTCISNGHGGYYPETGTVSVTVNGVQTATGSTSWGGTCDQYGNFTLGPTLAQIASNLASSLAGSAAGVNATSSGTTIQISAKATGTSTNYALSASYTATLSSPFVSVSAPASLTGGKNGASDSGTVAVTVGGFQASTTYGSGSTSSSIASALATQLSASGSPVTVQLSGSTITLTADTTGTASNYSLSGLVTWNTQSFSSPSFNISSSGSTLTGGANSSLGSPLVTLYSYDVLDNLTCSVQKGTDTTAFTSCATAPATWRPRSFVYDSLSRLTSAKNPESGTITYSYDANSNVSSMVSPRPGQFATATTAHNYTYDVENRKIQESHNPYDGNQKYAYDVATLTGCSGPSPSWITGATNLVHRTSAICSNYSSSTFSYDPMGRLATERRANEGSSTKTYNTGYAYWKDGSLNTLTYPSGSVVTYQVGGAGRVTNVSDSANNAYANSVTYAPHGALTGMTNGTSGTAIVTQNIYNNRLQPTVLSAKQNGQNPFFSLCYDFHSSTAINSPPCVFNAYTSGNNGNVFQVIDNYDSTRSATFAYDPLNRITQANTVNTTSANCWGEVFTLDNLGNLTNIGGVSSMGSCWHENLTGNPASNLNQLANYCYDAAGNLIQNSACPVVTPTYSYDGENRLSSTAGYTYHYDADGVRMEKSNGTSGTMYWTGPGGQYLTETDLTGSTINEEYVYFNGARIARVDRPSGAVHYYFSDQLSSASTITDPSGNVQERYYYYPYGGLVTSIGSDTNRYKFNGKERDTESNLDEFGARYYASTMGRFMTPDWAEKPTAVPYAHYGNPQSLNLYSFVQNNPTTMGDPDGHEGDPCGCEQAAIGMAELTNDASDYAGKILSSTWSDVKSAYNTVRGLFSHPDNTGSNAPPPGTVPTDASTGTPASPSGADVSTGTPGTSAEAPPGVQAPIKSGTALPDSYWIDKEAPTQVAPGTRQATDRKPSSRSKGEVYDRTTYYDQFGRSIGQTHDTHHGEPSVHPKPHHHTRNPSTGETSGPKPGHHPAHHKPEGTD
jgi:RHS repeat-associated protein